MCIIVTPTKKNLEVDIHRTDMIPQAQQYLKEIGQLSQSLAHNSLSHCTLGISLSNTTLCV